MKTSKTLNCHLVKEFNLSEKIQTGFYDAKPQPYFIDVKDVQEFIRLLKENLINNWGRQHCDYLFEIIDKLAGSKLNKKEAEK